MGSSLAAELQDGLMDDGTRSHYAEPAFLPDAGRARPGMQLEHLEDQPLNLQEFLNQPDDEDLDKLDESQDGLLHQ